MLRRASLAIAFALLAAAGCASEVGNNGARVGGSCTVSSDCDIRARCLTGVDWPNGICVESCDSDEDCLDGSRCVEEEGGICLVECAGAGDCRTSEDDGGYACSESTVRGAAGTAMVCLAE